MRTVGILLLVGNLTALGQTSSAARAKECPSCAEWNAPSRPAHIYGNTYYVGTAGLSSVLITSPRGHVLIDGGLPESAPLIIANIRALGFLIEDVRLIVNSHAHYDHAGGLAALQKASGAEVAATSASRREMLRGAAEPDDPQFAIALPYPRVERVREIRDGDTLRVGQLAVVAHATGGHTPGGTSWTWRSCEAARCFDIVYADSFTPISADGFLFSKSAAYPSVLSDFERSYAFLENAACDILLTPHPNASRIFQKLAARDSGKVKDLRTENACRSYAATARAALQKRLDEERGR